MEMKMTQLYMRLFDLYASTYDYEAVLNIT